jgi:hypothetical protein
VYVRVCEHVWARVQDQSAVGTSAPINLTGVCVCDTGMLGCRRRLEVTWKFVGIPTNLRMLKAA